MNRFLLALAAGFVALCGVAHAQCGPFAADGQFTNEKGSFVLAWKLGSSGTAVDIQMSVQGGSGFVAIGWGGGMLKADMNIGWVSDNGTVWIGDYWSTGHQKPQQDVDLGGINNVQPLCGQRNNGVTTLRFSRPLSTGDSFDVDVVNGVNDIIYAWGDGTPGLAFHGDNHNHIRVDFTKPDGIPDTQFGEEESGLAARQLVQAEAVGTLVTMQVEGAGNPQHTWWPYGSVAEFVDDGTGSPILLLSTLERNIYNWQNYKSCSLAVHTTSVPKQSYMTLPRTTLLGSLYKLEGAAYSAARKLYLTRHPDSVNWIDFPDFGLYHFNVSDVYYVGGFGNAHYIGWITPQQYQSHKL